MMSRSTTRFHAQRNQPMTDSPLKIRIAQGRLIAIGPGKADLLDAIIITGSISAAAKQMRMSYRRAWELVDIMNRCFREPLVVTNAGGSHGGGAVVTDLGMQVLQCYRAIVEKAAVAAADEIQQIVRCQRQAD